MKKMKMIGLLLLITGMSVIGMNAYAEDKPIDGVEQEISEEEAEDLEESCD